MKRQPHKYKIMKWIHKRQFLVLLRSFWHPCHLKSVWTQSVQRDPPLCHDASPLLHAIFNFFNYEDTQVQLLAIQVQTNGPNGSGTSDIIRPAMRHD